MVVEDRGATQVVQLHHMDLLLGQHPNDFLVVKPVLLSSRQLTGRQEIQRHLVSYRLLQEVPIVIRSELILESLRLVCQSSLIIK